jgi:hypothetical protein
VSDAPTAIDIDHTAFSIPELEHLLAHRPGTSADALAQVLNLGPVTSPTETLLTGGASLFVRGLLRFADDNTLELQGVSNQIALILTAAERWTVFAARSMDARDAGLLVESPEGTLMAHPRGLGTWAFIPIDPDAAIDRLISQTAVAYADSDEPVVVLVRTATHDIARSFTISREGDNWRFASGIADAETPEISREHATADEVAEHLSGFIGSWPNPLEH